VNEADAVVVSVIGPEVITPVLEEIVAARPDVLVVDMTTMPPHETRRSVAMGLSTYVTCPVFAQPEASARGKAMLLTACAAADCEAPGSTSLRSSFQP
jgi:3-hydroxyisobutyrate dehydrogenase-like beta-hydroxyacid dehydrogenase